MRCGVSSSRNRFVNIVVASQTHQIDMNASAIQTPWVTVCPWANDELATFTDAVRQELSTKAAELKNRNIEVELELNAVNIMHEFLRKRKLEESGASGISVWAESHAAIHTWDADNYFAFDAFSCKDFQAKDAIRLLLNAFDVETLNCINMLRYQRSAPTLTSFTINDRWHVSLNGKKVGELDEVDLNAL